MSCTSSRLQQFVGAGTASVGRDAGRCGLLGRCWSSGAWRLVAQSWSTSASWTTRASGRRGLLRWHRLSTGGEGQSSCCVIPASDVQRLPECDKGDGLTRHSSSILLHDRYRACLTPWHHGLADEIPSRLERCCSLSRLVLQHRAECRNARLPSSACC